LQLKAALNVVSGRIKETNLHAGGVLGEHSKIHPTSLYRSA
jgi:hypothetical protein